MNTLSTFVVLSMMVAFRAFLVALAFFWVCGTQNYWAGLLAVALELVFETIVTIAVKNS